MDFSCDRSGSVIVRDCGCSEIGKRTKARHGFISFWNDHSREWRRAHRIDALLAMRGERQRRPTDRGWQSGIDHVEKDVPDESR